eukprot:scaffold28499_cov65-Phaeocystis_antarctica.AAC.4
MRETLAKAKRRGLACGSGAQGGGRALRAGCGALPTAPFHYTSHPNFLPFSTYVHINAPLQDCVLRDQGDSSPTRSALRRGTAGPVVTVATTADAGRIPPAELLADHLRRLPHGPQPAPRVAAHDDAPSGLYRSGLAKQLQRGL